MSARTAISWVLRLFAAIILAQTLFFKFTGAEESRYIFSKIGMEPWGRYLVGMAELATAVLLVIPRTAWLGGLLGLGVLAGAIFFHLTILGIGVMDDDGVLFYLALAVFVACAGVLGLHWADLRAFIRRWYPSYGFKP